MEKKPQKSYHTNCNLLIVQDLWLSSLSNLVDNIVKKFIKLNANIVMIRKHAKCARLNAKIVSAVLNMQMLKFI